MGTGIFGIGLSGLNAAQAALVTTGHNISSANVPGYSRQEVVLAPNTPQLTGAGYFGNGVDIQSVRRAYDDFLTVQLRQVQSQNSELSTYYGQVKQLDNMLADSSSGLSPALQGFFGSVQEVATNPAAVASRQSMLSSAQSLVSRFQALDQRMTEIRSGINDQISASVGSINAFARQIATLNDAIVAAQAAAGGRPANDLEDQRDQLLVQLNQEVQATVVKQTDGSFNVFVGNGLPLVVGGQAFSLTAMGSPTDPTRTEVGYSSLGNATLLGTGALSGGRLGGTLQFRANSLDPAQNALGRVAIGLAASFNDQHRLGQDLNGAIGGNFFNIPGPAIGASGANTGNGVVSGAITNAGALTTSDYSLAYDGANYHLTRLSDNTVTNFASFPQTVDGVTLMLASGAVNAGDTYLVSPARNGASGISVAISDVAKIAAAAPMRAAAGAANVGSATATIGTVNAPPPANANIQQPVTITFTAAGTFDVSGTGTGNPIGVAYASGGNISYNGWTIQISGTPAIGDTFTVGPNSSGGADNRNALLLGALQARNTMANGTASYQSAYGQLVSDVGNKTHELEVTSQAQQSMLDQTQSAQQSVSGVNLDEEAANLIRFQQSYQASGKMIQIASQLFQSILSIGS